MIITLRLSINFLIRLRNARLYSNGYPKMRNQSMVSRKRSSVGGDSAGGNITAGLCIYNRDNKGPEIRKQILIYPATDLSGRPYYSYERYGSGYGLDNEAHKFSRAYVKNERGAEKFICITGTLR